MDEAQKKVLLEEQKQFFAAIGKRLDRWGEKLTTGRNVGIGRATVTRWVKGEVKPNLFRLYKIAELWHLSPAHLAFGEGPETMTDWNNFARLSTSLRHAKPDARELLFNALHLPIDLPLPDVQPLRFTAAAVARRLASAKPPTPRAQEAPAHYGRRIDSAALKRICDIVAGYVAHNPPPISLSQADEIRDVLALLQSIADDLPNRPADRGRAAEPNAGGATEIDATQDPPD